MHARQRTIATTAAYFWRFYLKQSFCDHEPIEIAVVCFSLASKAEENPVHDYSKLLKLTKQLGAWLHEEALSMKEEKLLALELLVLEELGFNMNVFDPYTPVRKSLKNASDENMIILAWGLLNDSLVWHCSQYSVVARSPGNLWCP